AGSVAEECRGHALALRRAVHARRTPRPYGGSCFDERARVKKAGGTHEACKREFPAQFFPL
ncbi:MAG TPA: hypothetical protein VNU64_05195, partial [Burkholderiales bacterium]|nr:hypothetical protein [Burkholderiales bacterium]